MNNHKSHSITVALVALVMTNFAYADLPTITDVTAHQRYPWNGKVDISYTVTGDIAEEAKQRAVLTSLKVTAINMAANTTNIATQLSGDLSLEEGTHDIVWDMDAEGLSFKSSNVVFKVLCETTPATYCVVDLSAGSKASSYPVTYLAEPPSGGFNVNEYKTTKLVLRRIEAGSFIMGDNQTDETHRVTLSEPFFCGIFEMTQKQYQLVTGSNQSSLRPSSDFPVYISDTCPVCYVSYDMIRGSSDGAAWPSSSTVDDSSFMGMLRTRTGLNFDLPTEAQWEYACRAGTSTRYSYGNSVNGDYMWYEDNSGRQCWSVGTKYANTWGLYDMHGNGWEWCLDWYGTLAYSNDPKGFPSGTGRVLRSGYWRTDADGCTSSYRTSSKPSSKYKYGPWGFRLFRTVSHTENVYLDVLCYGESEMEKVDVVSNTRITTQMEKIRYSSAWVSGEDLDTVAIVEVNGERLNLATGSGYVDWMPMSNGTYKLAHKIVSGGVQIGETLTATFIADGLKTATPVFSPVSGTMFENQLSVSITCDTEGATIHYTVDGSEPTLESPVYRRFRINGKTTVKAFAEKEGWFPSDVVVAEYALGQCDDPVITPSDGSTFDWAGKQVAINWQGEDGVLRYTTDGSDPTRESPVYDGPFTISDSTVVKAKAFSDNYFDSAVVTANITRVWTNVATPQIEAANSFTGSKTKVVISCATEGATIRYTLDGSVPDSNSSEYTGPIYVTNSCTVKAFAVKYDYHDSGVATKGIEKVWCIGDSLGKPDHGFTTDGSAGAGWVRVVDATAPNGEAMKSGAITHDQSSVLATTVVGPGTLTFSWRTSCEDSGGAYDWDHVEFAVDGTVLLKRDGINVWESESVVISGEGEHTVTWTYMKDDVEGDGDDAAYVAGYGWASDLTETQTT